MIHFELRQTGQNAVRNELRTAASEGGKHVNNAAYDWAQGVVVPWLKYGRGYPPERPGQKYRRTYQLRDGWDARRNPGSVTILNRMDYAGYVVGDSKGAGQVWFHKNRWWVARDEIASKRPELRALVLRELDRLFAIGAKRR